MNKKGFAATGILYTILVLFILLMMGILTMLYSRNSLLDTIKKNVKNEIINGNTCSNLVGTVWNFDYTGSEQTFTVPCSGTYKLETWGSSGGYAYDSTRSTGGGGYGGYSTGEVILSTTHTLFVNVGGEGKSNCQTTSCDGGYNGGSTSTKWANGSGEGLWTGGGGGATHIAIKSGLLSTLENYKSHILIVSGGGGGGDYYPSWSDNNYRYSASGGSGGGYIGGNGIQGAHDTSYSSGIMLSNYGGSQTSGSSFGKATTTCLSDSTGGGGGGYYGGFASTVHTTGGGGSGYIGNSLLTNKAMYCYNCTESSDVSTKTVSTTCTNSTPTVNCAKKGNGYAKITLISLD